MIRSLGQDGGPEDQTGPGGKKEEKLPPLPGLEQHDLRQFRRFYGTVTLPPARLGRDAGQIQEAIVQHLALLKGADVEVTFEIHARIPDGVPEDVLRTVTENCRTLRFASHAFEEA